MYVSTLPINVWYTTFTFIIIGKIASTNISKATSMLLRIYNITYSRGLECMI